jgi:hypothetical protein
VRGLILGVLCTLAGIASMPLAPLVALFIRWDTQPTPGSYGEWPTVRGDLPRWLRCFQTPDERFPGGLYEPAVRHVLDFAGRYWCSVYWMTRNALMGLPHVFAVPVAEAWDGDADPPLPEGYTRYDWKGRWLKGGYGWKTARTAPRMPGVPGRIVAIPFWTVRLASQD